MKPRVLKLIAILAALLAVAFVAWIIVSADEDHLPGFITALYDFPNGDKLGHFLLMGTLALILTLALPKRFRLTGLIILAAGLAIEEFSQRFFQHRTSSWLDLASSLAGIVVFGGLCLWLTRSIAKKMTVKNEEKEMEDSHDRT
jgi:polysaccharide biosynthesis protein VpsQ